jgi:hypothetical protein
MATFSSQYVRYAARLPLRGRGGEAAVAGGHLLGEFGEGFLAGGAVDTDALAGVAGGEDVSGGLPPAVLALVDGSVAVGANAGSGGHRLRLGLHS